MSDRRGVSWQQIVMAVSMILITAGLAATGYLFKEARADIKELNRIKLDKTEYYEDIREVKQGIININNAILRHEENSRKRYRGEDGE